MKQSFSQTHLTTFNAPIRPSCLVSPGTATTRLSTARDLEPPPHGVVTSTPIYHRSESRLRTSRLTADLFAVFDHLPSLRKIDVGVKIISFTAMQTPDPSQPSMQMQKRTYKTRDKHPSFSPFKEKLHST